MIAKLEKFPSPPKRAATYTMDIVIETASRCSSSMLEDLINFTADGTDVKYLSFPKGERIFRIFVDYPCTPVVSTYSIRIDRCISAGRIVSMIAETYFSLYREEQHYGVWGHYLKDLCLEKIHIDQKTCRIWPVVGS
jgi:hypothetical protein